MKRKLRRVDIVILTLILILAVAARLYKINTPLADFHSWRQADTAAVARNFVKDGFNLLVPRYDDLSNIQSGLDNPQGYRMVEFPLYNATFAFLYKLYPPIPLHVWGRIVTIFFSLIIIAILYYLSLMEITRLAAIASALTYSIFPFFVFFSRVVLPETMSLALAFIAILLLYVARFVKGKKNIKQFFLILFSSIFFSLSILVKPSSVFYLFVILYLFMKLEGFELIKSFRFYFYFILTFLPLLLWRVHIQHYKEGIPVYLWLLTRINTAGGEKYIFLKPAFFRWIFFERINKVILGGYLTAFLVIGMLRKYKKLFMYFVFFSALLYLFVFEGGNVQHNYYQTIILPALALGVGGGISFIFERHKSFISPLFSSLIVLSLFALSLYFSFYEVKNLYNYPKDLIKIASISNNLIPPKSKVVTDTMGDTTLLYLMDRRGAPSIYHSIPELKKKGYDYLVALHKETINEMEKKKKKVIFKNAKFAIFKL